MKPLIKHNDDNNVDDLIDSQQPSFHDHEQAASRLPIGNTRQAR